MLRSRRERAPSLVGADRRRPVRLRSRRYHPAGLVVRLRRGHRPYGVRAGGSRRAVPQVVRPGPGGRLDGRAPPLAGVGGRTGPSLRLRPEPGPLLRKLGSGRGRAGARADLRRDRIAAGTVGAASRHVGPARR
ncbi:hypothetical protein LQ51_30810, partial [Micromonospora sp. HK10]